MNRYEQIEDLKRRYRHNLPEPDPGWPPRVQRAVKCINTHLFSPRLTVGWMKTRCRINGHNFASRFNYYVEQTPKQFIIYHRIEMAKYLLVEPRLKDLHISTIAYEAGLHSLASFDMTFKEHTSCTPSEFRQKHSDC